MATSPAPAGAAARPRYLAPKEVCEIIPGMTPNWLAQLRFSGKGPKFLEPTGKSVLYREADVIEWLEASERSITGDVA